MASHSYTHSHTYIQEGCLLAGYNIIGHTLLAYFLQATEEILPYRLLTHTHIIVIESTLAATLFAIGH